MIYFDTDILVHTLIKQDTTKHAQATELYGEALRSGKFFISLLCIQETAFVLQKLGETKDRIDETLSTLLKFQPKFYNTSEMRRGVDLAKKIGFQHINDCLHLAIAEEYCSELYTFNKQDFKKLAKFSDIKIKILE